MCPLFGGSIVVAKFNLASKMSRLGRFIMAVCVCRGGKLHQFASDEDDEAKNIYQLRNCGGCVRATAENKPFAVSVCTWHT